MKRKTGIAAVLLCVLLLLTACGEKPESQAEAPAPESESAAVLPEDAKNEEGIVLDASDGQFILRTGSGSEYVFRMSGTEDLVEGGVKAGQFVRIWYTGTLTGTNASSVRLLRIEPADENAQNLLTEGSVAQGKVVSVAGDVFTLETAQGESLSFRAENSQCDIKDGMREEIWVRVYFDGTPEKSVVTQVTECAAQSDAFTLTGKITALDEETGTMTLSADTGEKFTLTSLSARKPPVLLVE